MNKLSSARWGSRACLKRYLVRHPRTKKRGAKLESFNLEFVHAFESNKSQSEALFPQAAARDSQPKLGGIRNEQ